MNLRFWSDVTCVGMPTPLEPACLYHPKRRNRINPPNALFLTVSFVSQKQKIHTLVMQFPENCDIIK